LENSARVKFIRLFGRKKTQHKGKIGELKFRGSPFPFVFSALFVVKSNS
jgi:hypothetical protein